MGGSYILPSSVAAQNAASLPSGSQLLWDDSEKPPTEDSAVSKKANGLVAQKEGVRAAVTPEPLAFWYRVSSAGKGLNKLSNLSCAFPLYCANSRNQLSGNFKIS